MTKRIIYRDEKGRICKYPMQQSSAFHKSNESYRKTLPKFKNTWATYAEMEKDLDACPMIWVRSPYIIRWEKEYRRIFSFETIDDMINFIQKTEANVRSFHEVINGDLYAKMFFDIDLKTSEITLPEVDKEFNDLADALADCKSDDEYTALCQALHTRELTKVIAFASIAVLKSKYLHIGEIHHSDNMDNYEVVKYEDALPLSDQELLGLSVYVSHSLNRISAHIILSRVILNGYKARQQFSDDVKDYIRREGVGFVASEYSNILLMGKIIDNGVHNSRSNFRLPHCVKKDDPSRVMRPVKMGDINPVFADAIGTLPEVECLDEFNPEAFTRGYISHVVGGQLWTRIDDGTGTQCEVVRAYDTVNVSGLTYTIEDVTRVFADIFEIYDIEKVFDNTIRLKRKAPGFCPICQTHHDSDNGNLFLHKDYVRFHCFRATANKMPSRTLSRKIGTPDSSPSALIEFGDSVDMPAPELPPQTWADKMREINELSLPKYMPDINPTKIINKAELSAGDLGASRFNLIHSDMGTGKTLALFEYIKRRNVRSAIIPSMRIASTTEFVSKWEASGLGKLWNYREIDGEICAKKHAFVIVEIEAMCRVNVEGYDLLVLDELSSLFMQKYSMIDATNFRMLNMKLSRLMENCKQVIALDALPSLSAFESFRALSPAGSVWNIVHNEYRRNPKRIRYMQDTNDFMECIKSDLTAGKRLAVAATYGYADLRAIATMMLENVPGLIESDISIHANHADSADVENLKNINEYWGTKRLVLYSPTISSGISYTGAPFDKLYCYFSPAEIPAFGKIQMMGRIRNFTSDEVTICDRSITPKSCNRLPFTPETVREAIETRVYTLRSLFRKDGSKSMEPASFSYHYDGEERIKCGDDSTTRDMVLYLCEKNFQHNFGTRILLDTFKQLAWPVEFVNRADCQPAEVVKAMKSISALRSVIKSKDIDNIINAPDVDEAEANRLSNSRKRLTRDEGFKLKKHKFKQLYKISSIPDAEYYKRYNKQAVRDKFKRMCQWLYLDKWEMDAACRLMNYAGYAALDSDTLSKWNIDMKHVLKMRNKDVISAATCDASLLRLFTALDIGPKTIGTIGLVFEPDRLADKLRAWYDSENVNNTFNVRNNLRDTKKGKHPVELSDLVRQCNRVLTNHLDVKMVRADDSGNYTIRIVGDLFNVNDSSPRVFDNVPHDYIRTSTRDEYAPVIETCVDPVALLMKQTAL